MFISWWLDFARQNWRKEDGQTMAEYGVVLAVITVGAIARLHRAVWRYLEGDQQRDVAAPVAGVVNSKTRKPQPDRGINAMSRTISRAKEFFRRNQGQTMPEYAVVLAVVSSGSAFLLAGLGARVGCSATAGDGLPALEVGIG